MHTIETEGPSQRASPPRRRTALTLPVLLSSENHTAIPSDEFELTANTLQANMKPHSKFILKPLIYLTAES